MANATSDYVTLAAHSNDLSLNCLQIVSYVPVANNIQRCSLSWMMRSYYKAV